MDFDFDIFQIYRQYCDITSGMPGDEGECHSPDDESEKVRFSREALGQLLKTVVSKVSSRISVLEEVYKLMTGLDLMTDFKEFSRFYDFVFFVCRENGQRNITVSRAVMAWRLVLAGRFRLLNQWCSFVEENQRHNISEDTWRQVLAFSRCVHENLEGYDPDGAWPILIDDFVEHMYRITGTHGAPSLFCSCGDSESQQLEDTLSGTEDITRCKAFSYSIPDTGLLLFDSEHRISGAYRGVAGLRILPGSKRKMSSSMLMEEETSDAFTASCNMKGFKRRQLHSTERSIDWRQNLLGDAKDECVEEMKHQTPVGCTKSTCAVERCLSKGFAGLFSSGRSFLRL